MKPKLTTPLLAAIGAVALMVTLFLSFYFSTSAYRTDTPGIVLPSESADTPIIPDSSADTRQPVLQSVSITAENVQEVIASLSRPAAYSYEAQNTLYYDGKSHMLTRRQYFKNAACRTDEMSESGVVQRSTLRFGENTYAWENGAAHYYTGAAGEFTDDGAAMLPTYETVLALSRESIAEAKLLNLNYEPCILVKSQGETFSGAYYISAVSGLLVRADIYEGEALVRSCAIRAVSTAEPDDAYFELPDGNSVFAIKE